MRPGVRLAVDLGRVRIGVARCDASATLALPVTTVARGTGDIASLHALAEEWQPIEIIVGLPVTLAGEEGLAAAEVRAWTSEFLGTYPDHVLRLVDERLTTAGASRALREAGLSTRHARPVVDQVAAVMLLDDALEYERRTGQAPGELL